MEANNVEGKFTTQRKNKSECSRSKSVGGLLDGFDEWGNSIVSAFPHYHPLQGSEWRKKTDFLQLGE